MRENDGSKDISAAQPLCGTDGTIGPIVILPNESRGNTLIQVVTELEIRPRTSVKTTATKATASSRVAR